MKKLDNPVLQEFIEILIEAIKEENETREHHFYEENKPQLDIPFLISALYQSFKNNSGDYEEFINDLYNYDYDVLIECSKNDWNGIIDARINLFKDDIGGAYNIYDIKKYYEICFSREDRDWGYCECTPDMPDYRADKGCCGHGCDACFCSFELNKGFKVTSDSWDGDESSYWEFEDEFYEDEKEIAEINKKKQKKEIEARIEELKKCLEETNRMLENLEVV